MCYYTFMSLPRKRGRRYRAKSLTAGHKNLKFIYY